MLISELFYSIQGEGKRAGFPSFFIRTNNCNLKCKFKSGNLCDSAYTSWEPHDKNNIGEMSVENIANNYLKYKNSEIYDTNRDIIFSESHRRKFLQNEKTKGCNNIVITGGEPTVQVEELLFLCKKLKSISPDIHITIETNGTKTGEFLKFTDLVSISPKLKSSIPYTTQFEDIHNKNRINIDSLILYHHLHQQGLYDIQWKFVFNDESDIEEILDLKEKVGFRSTDVYLMPEGITKEEIESKRGNIIKLCLKYNFNYCERLHILIWGNARGR